MLLVERLVRAALRSSLSRLDVRGALYVEHEHRFMKVAPSEPSLVRDVIGVGVVVVVVVWVV